MLPRLHCTPVDKDLQVRKFNGEQLALKRRIAQACQIPQEIRAAACGLMAVRQQDDVERAVPHEVFDSAIVFVLVETCAVPASVMRDHLRHAGRP